MKCVAVLLVLQQAISCQKCSLHSLHASSYYQDGDFIIGGLITVQTSVYKVKYTFKSEPYGFKTGCRVMNFRNYQSLLMFVFAIKEINDNEELLPNVTLGFHILDNCLSEEKAVTGMLRILSGNTYALPNYQCGPSSTVISYSSMDPILSDKIQFPSFYRTVPTDNLQCEAIKKLLNYFGWSWVGILSSNNESGFLISQCLRRKFAQQDSCFAFVGFIPFHDAKSEEWELWVVHTLRTTSANVIVVYGKRYKCIGNETIKDCEHVDAFKDISFYSYNLYKAVYLLTYALHIFVKKTNPSTVRRSLPWKTPTSKCSESCPPGFRKSTRKDLSVCCYECIPCSEGEISDKPDMDTCFKCPSDMWPNSRRDNCKPKVVIYLSYEEPLGTSLAVLALLLFLLTCWIMIIFRKYRTTAIVKANNRDLSFILLISLKMCFLCAFIFIGYPIPLTCILRQTVFGVTFSISISSILTKTIIVIIAFNATKPGSKLRNWMKPSVYKWLLVSCSLLQVLICVCWLSTAPPFPHYNMNDELGKIIVECHEGSPVGFYFVVGYLGFLALTSFFIAFFAKNLPDKFNEAKLITFSMVVFCSVWITFIPAYLSTKGKYVVAVEIFAIISSSAGLLGCIFIPKCYIIIFKPQWNTNSLEIKRTKQCK
ncbi:vomeronasal type-2 receptor 26-like [Leptodactylus fuscus]|uniref:vomeronasal type-2 receptor 26-like n=1 Tax=Leptodactylus fuscus TaxID=238119 RepID=UPI003F4E6ED6